MKKTQKSQRSQISPKSQILEGSNAIARVINNIKPAVVSAYPITPQTHIVEDLAKFKADGQANYEYILAESEFAAASIVAGASATGVRVYTATSSQGLLLMAEVLFNIAGMRLPVVLTCANRGVSAPITIWNDHQDAMTVRDAGWIMFFSENHQEAVEQHIIAYKIAESLKIPVMVNVDGFILTHSYESVNLPTAKEIKKFLPDYQPTKGEYLDVTNPVSLGAFAAPPYYMEIREQLHNDLVNAQNKINDEYASLAKIIPDAVKAKEKATKINNGLIEYYGPDNPKTVLIALGSMVGTIKDVVDEINSNWLTDKIGLPAVASAKVGIIKIKCFRPFPAKDILKIIKNTKNSN
ncbi:MAG: pyruvate ferredoxin oxidoreductase [Candidatus Falkowbacteria bacterium]|nr:pyruvate ferredoxin oxidoreductase [Candidatus Falkowbacteria bacterium]